MKTIGLLCGLSWVSTQIYYETINRRIAQELKGINSARMIMNSLNADSVVSLINNNHLDSLEVLLKNECLKLEQAGCDFVAITCNTVHAFFNSIQDALKVPLIHIMDGVVRALRKKKVRSVGILGTEFTIKKRLYDQHLQHAEIHAIYPHKHEVDLINNIIFKLCSSILLEPQEVEGIHAICDRLGNNGADAIILGCTELGLVLNQRTDITLFDSAVIHAEDLASYSLHIESENLPRQKNVDPQD